MNIPQTAIIDDEVISLLEFMLEICPKKRPTAEQVLAHPFFQDTPKHAEFDFSALMDDQKIANTYTKPKAPVTDA